MKITKQILGASLFVVLIASIVGAALARGGGHGSGFSGGFGGGSGGGGMSGGGMRASSGMHNGGMSGSMYRGGGMSGSMYRGGGPSSQFFSSRSPGRESFARGDGGRQSFNRDLGGRDSGNREFGNRMAGNGDSGSRDSANRIAGNRDSSNRGSGSWAQLSERGRNPNYDRVVSFLNDKGNDRNGGPGSMGHEGDFRQRFKANDRFDRNGDNFRHNADSIRKDFHDRDRHDIPFRSGWWDHRRFDRGFGPWGFDWWRGNPWYWWGWTTAPYLDSWLAFGWNQPCYWDYGPGGYVYYNYPSNEFYQGGQPYQPANTYYQQVYDLAHSAPELSKDDAAKSDWLPLGVFSLSKEGKKEENWTVQLGVNKQGVLSGTYYNQANDGAHPLVGMVDKTTHKAAWYFADGSSDKMVFETSVDNLTEPQSTVMVHFGPGDAGVWQMVRLERPEASENQQPEALPTPPQHELP